jgi:phosphomannomutase
MKISVSGIRGVYGKDLTINEIYRLSRLFGSGLLDLGGKCVLGRDTRPSSRIVTRVVESALMAQGIDVYNIDIAPTPAVFREARRYHAGCVITASHNPLDWNGLKFVINGRGLYENELDTMLDRLVQQQSTNFGRSVRGFSSYIEELLELAQSMQMVEEIKIGLDPGGGAACQYSNILFRRLGCKVASINDTVGIHSRNPDPTVDDLRELRALVRCNSLDLGLALDLDGDRLVVIDKTGKKLTSDVTLLFCVANAMRLGIRKFVISVDTSLSVKEFIVGHNGIVYYSKVGEANVVKEMSELGAEAGGEGSSAGFIMSKFNMCRDGLLAGVLISSLDRESMTDCLRLSSKYIQIRSKLAADSRLHKDLIERLYDVFLPISSEASEIDGIKLVMDENSWVLIRPSNTEHAVRISVESLADKTSALYKEIISKAKLVYDEIR